MIVEANGVRFAYVSDEGKYTFALNDVDISIEKGEFVTILGHNGSGKSTFAKLVNALNVPTDGEVLIDGMDTRVEDNILDIRKTAGMVFQNPDNQLVATIVEEDIAFGPENLGISREEIGERIDYALSVVHMEKYRKHAPHMLSGGQKQRIAIAGVLAMKPKIIVFDESTAMLDPKGRKDVLNIMRDLNRNEGITIILITHYMEEAVFSDRVYILDDGKVLKQGTPSEVFFDYETVKQTGLTLPFEARLIKDMEESGIAIRHTLDTEELLEGICQLK
jgi:energy-coupling factor transport system ATP-binding protein